MFPDTYPKFQEQLLARDSVDRYFVKDTATCSATAFFEDFDGISKKALLSNFSKSFNAINLKIFEFANLKMR